MNRKAQVSIFVILLLLVAFAVFYVFALGPFTFLASDIGLSQPGSNVGVWGFFVAWFPYIILISFIAIGVLWRLFAG